MATKQLKMPLKIVQSFREEFVYIDNHELTWEHLYEHKRKTIKLSDLIEVVTSLAESFDWLIFKRLSVAYVEEAAWTASSGISYFEWLSNLSKVYNNQEFTDQLIGIEAIFNFELDSLIDLTHIRNNSHIEIDLEDELFSVDISVEDFPFYQKGVNFFSNEAFPQEMVTHNRQLLTESLNDFIQATEIELHEFYTENTSGDYTMNVNGIEG